ncbi:MAG: S-formylglutathione hydrolase [Micavibrio sp.]|nr:S-formylglutathione hydrolase [Micavibrio sp.]
MIMEILETHRCHGGTLGIYRHDSTATACPMRFSLFLPPQAAQGKVPVLYFLSGLTCTEENFTFKAGAYRHAAELGVAIVVCDTSPRGDDVPDAEGYDIGKGAGFYLDATHEPWAKNYHMESYVTQDLPALIAAEFPQIDTKRAGIFGHSMGGHGALTLFFRHRHLYKSVSALAPICSPTQCAWGDKIFPAYLGLDHSEWKKHDATLLVATAENVPTILIDQGRADQFLATNLRPDLFEAACHKHEVPLTLRYHEGYDHSYYFIQTFIDDHLDHHMQYLA